MPMIILMIFALFGGIGILVGFFTSLAREPAGKWFLLIGMIFSLATIPWLCLSMGQDMVGPQYHYIDTMIDSKGVHQHYVYPKFFDEPPVVVDVKARAKLKIVLPEDTIVKVWKFNQWKNGINWMNDKDVLCEVITPLDKEYKNVKDKAVRHSLKEN